MTQVQFLLLAARPRITRDDEVSDVALSDSAWSETKAIMGRLQHAFVCVLKRKKRVLVGNLWVYLFAHKHCTHTDWWLSAHTQNTVCTKHFLRSMSHFRLLLQELFQLQYANQIWVLAAALASSHHTTGERMTTRSSRIQMASRLGSPMNHVQKRIMSSDLMSWQLWHISTQATHLVPFFETCCNLLLRSTCLSTACRHLQHTAPAWWATHRLVI